MTLSPGSDAANRVGQRVCIVDDDASVCTSLKRLLHTNNVPAVSFSSAAEFLASPLVDTFACAILDIRMPGMDGLALQEWLSAHGSRISVIFVTAHDEASARERAFRNGAAGFFFKPVRGKELLDAVCAAMGGGVEHRAQSDAK